MDHGVGGARPGKLGGSALTLGGNAGTVLCNPRQGSCNGPKDKSLALAKGDIENGDGFVAKPPPYRVNGDSVLPARYTMLYGLLVVCVMLVLVPMWEGGAENNDPGWP